MSTEKNFWTAAYVLRTTPQLHVPLLRSHMCQLLLHTTYIQLYGTLNTEEAKVGFVLIS